MLLFLLFLIIVAISVSPDKISKSAVDTQQSNRKVQTEMILQIWSGINVVGGTMDGNQRGHFVGSTFGGEVVYPPRFVEFPCWYRLRAMPAVLAELQPSYVRACAIYLLGEVEKEHWPDYLPSHLLYFHRFRQVCEVLHWIGVEVDYQVGVYWPHHPSKFVDVPERVCSGDPHGDDYRGVSWCHEDTCEGTCVHCGIMEVVMGRGSLQEVCVDEGNLYSSCFTCYHRFMVGLCFLFL